MSSPDVTVQLPATPTSLDTGLADLVSAPGHTSDTGPLKPGQTFGPRYHIIRLLGVGGMGAVYHAWDTELAVSVAIKVIRPEIMANPAAGADVERRFKRELLLARQVTHRNVVRIHDLGEIDHIKYITMSYVNGVDLATKIKDVRALPVANVMSLARAVVSGLVAAHTAGVVHRDLKPANIMIGVGGDTLIMDFGIARSSSAGTAEAVAVTAALPAHLQTAAAATMAAHGGTMITPGGTVTSAATTNAGDGIVGTVQYMAPEQAGGLPVDQRADIYAFGLILYDALAGFARLESPDGPVGELRARMERPPSSVRSLVPEVPEPLDRLISRCLDPLPDKRFQTTTELEAELATLDEQGELIPVKRVFGTWTLATVIVLAVAALGGGWWYARSLIPPPAHAAVQVVIADFKNNTGDATFDRTVEPMLRRSLQTASFITAYDRSGIVQTLGVKPPDVLDEKAAQELAVKQGLGIVLSGAIDRQGSGYSVSMKAAQTVTGTVVVDTQARAASAGDVLKAATNLVANVTRALGDEHSESAKIFANASLSANSLQVARLYAASQDAASNGRLDEARQNALKATELDPKFGVGYQLLAVSSRNAGNLQDAETYINEALQYLDTMTERERYATRGFYYRIAGNWPLCVKQYGELVTRYAADPVGHNQRALCLTKLRSMNEAVSEMQQVVALLPRRAIFRANLALYANYASDFETGEKEARAIQESGAYLSIPVAQAQTGKGQLIEAAETYRRLATLDSQGPSFAASGLGDLAIYEGRYSEAAKIFEQGAAADLAAKSRDKAAMKLVSLAYAQVQRGLRGAAMTAAENALQNSKAVPIRFLAARVLVDAGSADRAKTLADDLATELLNEPQAYAKIIDGDIALKNGRPRDAIKALTAANDLLDTWIGDFDLGRAYLEAGLFAEADSQFDRCLKRRGEALSLFVDEEPTYGYFPPVYYYQGRVREGLKNAGFADAYRAYIAIRGTSNEDALLTEARRRAGR
jgi:eukaryotic-like serine/threonine-protein kinase